MVQQIITWLVVGVAVFLVLRHVWAEVDGFIHPDKAGGCPGCGMCDAAKDEAARTSLRPPPAVRMTPLVSLQTSRPAHLRRPEPREPDGGAR